jgi:hypothetical protein
MSNATKKLPVRAEPAVRHEPLIITGSIALLLAVIPAFGRESVSANTNIVAEEMRLLHDQMQEQSQRLDRLYRAFRPRLKAMEAEADRLEAREKQDQALTMERLSTVVDGGLTGQGCVNPAAAEFAAITGAGAVRIYDVQGHAGKEFRLAGQEITAVAFSPNGDALLAGTETGALLVWDLAGGSCLIATTNNGTKIGRVAWLSNNRLAWGANLSYWERGGKPINRDRPSGTVLARATGQTLWQFKSFIRDDFFTLAGGANGRYLAVLEVPGQPRGAFLLDGDTGEISKTCYDQEHGSGPLSIAISPDDATLAVGYAPYDIILWDVRTGERQKLLKGHENWVVSLAFSADSKRLISGAGDCTARVWNIQTGKEIGRLRFEGESTYIHSVGLSPKGDIAFALAAHGHLISVKVPSVTSTSSLQK